MIDMASISAALGSAKAAMDLLGVAVKARDQHKIAAALQELQDRYMSLVIAATQVAEKNAALVEELATARQQVLELQQRASDAEAREAQRAQYELVELAPQNWVYRHRPSVEAGQRVHYLCQPCFDKGEKAVLKEFTSWGLVELCCPLCGQKYDTGERRPIPPMLSGVRWSG